MVVDTTEQAEFDFAKLNTTARQQDSIAENLRDVPWSRYDRHHGSLSIRKILSYDVAFILSPEEDIFVVLVVALELAGRLETLIELAQRAALEELTPAAKLILQGRKRRLE